LNEALPLAVGLVVISRNGKEISLSLCILPRASKYLDLPAILCVAHATDIRTLARYSRVYGILNYQLLDNDYPNDSRPLKRQIEDISVSSRCYSMYRHCLGE